MDLKDFIEVNPKILMGKPVIKDTRVAVELILEKLSDGETVNDLLISYPNLTEEKIRAALLFAAQALRGENA
jgi:uncharacterized protein (DUF433 family)